MLKKTAFVCGYPIGQTLSPFIHRHWLKLYQKKGDYEPIQVSINDFESFFKKTALKKFIGGNITIPHKERAYALADLCEEAVRKIGAANMVWYEKGKICVGNSDVYGFNANLDSYFNDWAGGVALVFGAGGAARAVIYALKDRGCEKIYVVNRTLQRAEDLSDYFGTSVLAYSWDKISTIMPVVDLIVNTTSKDMGKKVVSTSEALCGWPDFTKAKDDALVVDIVYKPLITPFLHLAQQRGLRIIDGLGMLLHQAVPGFEKWFGLRPHVDESLREAVLQELARKNIFP